MDTQQWIRSAIVALALATSQLASPLPARAGGWTGFEFPLLGAADRMVLNPYYETAWGFTFTAVPIGQQEGEVGLVRSNASPVCIDPDDSGQMLGSANSGSGAIGEGWFPIRVDLAAPALPPVVISVTVQTVVTAAVEVKLFDAEGNLLAAQDLGTANLITGTCVPQGYPNKRSGNYKVRVENTPVAWVIIDTTPEAIFVIDDFVCLEEFVAVQPSTWGRIKALYRAE